MKPLLAAAATEAGDDQLVEAVREGSDEAFEALYRRYRPRILAYVRSMCGDHARAEDVTQEAFMSALRGLRSCDKEILFRPWMYEIAKNACIDHIRRAGRGHEVSIDSDDFGAQEEGRISESISGTDAAVARRKALESLQMAFGDLPESQHRILVMRELEGLSYERIGSRMGLSKGAVESLLFRARRTLRDGFDDIDTGSRCERMYGAMEAVADGRRTGIRDRRRLTSHLRQCAECRRAAVTIGLDELALAAARDRGRSLRRAVLLLPLPPFLRRRLEDGAGLLNSLGPAADQGVSLAAKATAVVVAAALAAGGAGVATKASGGGFSVPVVGGGSSAGGDGNAGAADDGDGGGSGAGARGGAGGTGGPAGQTGAERGAPSGSGGGPGDGATGGRTGAEGGGRNAAGDLTGTLDGAAGGALQGAGGALQGADGTVGASPGGTVNRLGDQVNGIVGKTGDAIEQGTGVKAPLPKVDPGSPSRTLDSTRETLDTVTGGGGRNSLPDAGGVLNTQPPQLPVKPPEVQLPRTEVTLPGAEVRLLP